ncbi:hypothetical protein [Paracoccus solventivorans]|nr:hypothetical protein [Paracoccus solventivorans]
MRITIPNARGGGKGCEPAAGILLAAAPVLAQLRPSAAALPAAALPVAT